MVLNATDSLQIGVGVNGGDNTGVHIEKETVRVQTADGVTEIVANDEEGILLYGKKISMTSGENTVKTVKDVVGTIIEHGTLLNTLNGTGEGSVTKKVTDEIEKAISDLGVKDTQLENSINTNATAILSKQPLLTGNEFKTINGQSIMGEGDIEIEGGEGGGIDSEPTNAVIESIEPNLVSTALRKTAQVLTEAEKEQARQNIGAQQQLQLTVKDNGNIVLSNLDGQTKEFMPATPSGDPMHWAYVSAGAEYNATDEYILKDAPWKDMVDTIEDKAKWGLDVVDASQVKQMTIGGTTYNYVQTTRQSPEGTTEPRYFLVGQASDGTWVEDETKVLHLPGHWYLNGLGDITDAEMRSIYAVERLEVGFELQRMWMVTKARSILKANNHTEILITNGTYCFYGISCESLINYTIKYDDTISTHAIPISNANAILENSKIKYSTPFLMKASSFPERTFKGCAGARVFLLLQIKASVILSSSPLISKSSILYAINNATTTSAITITLHADAYARLAEDADIVAALAAKPLVTLVSA
jgi:hypothetical protein